MQALEGDVLNGLLRYHEMTAILDKIAPASCSRDGRTWRRTSCSRTRSSNCSRASKRLRDTEATTINMQLVTWRDGRAANEAIVAGTGDALRTWRQP